MKKFLCIYAATLLLILGVVLSGCSEDADRQKTSTPQKKVVVPQNRPAPAANRTAESSVWPPATEKQENILPADQWTRKNYVMIFDGSGSMGLKAVPVLQQKMLLLRKLLLSGRSRSLPKRIWGLSSLIKTDSLSVNSWDRAAGRNLFSRCRRLCREPIRR
ncbi:MAG: hypothetical protein V8K32_11115 [Candidatus Electrothrix gigas]